MSTDDPTMEIALENVGGTSGGASVLTTLSSQYGSQTLRFVARAGGGDEFVSDPFIAAGSITPMAPREDWAPGMTESLTQLRRDIERAGWIEMGRGDEEWAFRYTKDRHSYKHG